MTFFRGFLSLSTPMLEYYFEIGHYHLFTNRYLLINHDNIPDIFDATEPV
jgi:hypothetical protein